jgi:hypothetical protein
MVAKLRVKPGAEQIAVTIGDFATANVEGRFSVAYLVFNTIMNLTTEGADPLLPERRRTSAAGWGLRDRGCDSRPSAAATR